MAKQINNSVTQKDVAVFNLRELGVSIPNVLEFESCNIVYLFEGDKISRVARGSGLESTIRRLEEKHNIIIYAISHDFLDFGEMYSFLCVSPYPEDWDIQFRRITENLYMAYAYVWNMSMDIYSEFGSVVLQTGHNSIRRVG